MMNLQLQSYWLNTTLYYFLEHSVYTLYVVCLMFQIIGLIVHVYSVKLDTVTEAGIGY